MKNKVPLYVISEIDLEEIDKIEKMIRESKLIYLVSRENRKITIYGRHLNDIQKANELVDKLRKMREKVQFT